MKNAYQKQQESTLKKIAAALPKSASATLVAFVRGFYEKTTVSDLQRLDPRHAVAIATSAYSFIERRAGGAPKIRIFTPTQKTHGYEGKYTVVELLNSDMPFLVDSLTAEISRQGFVLRETIHPIFHVRRDAKGTLTALADEVDAKAKPESLIHFEVGAVLDKEEIEKLQAGLEWTLENIRAAVEDWEPIQAKAKQAIERLKSSEAHFPKAEVSEARDFIRWLLDRNFVFLGYAEYNFFDTKGKEKLTVVPDSKLGVLKLAVVDEHAPQGLETLPPEVRHFLLVPQIMEITKANRRSAVHRAVPMDYIGIKRFDAKGKVVGEIRFLGLFTSNVYYQSAEEIPLARHKVAEVLRRSAFNSASHDGKSLKAILEFLPRDEIFQMTADDLLETSMGILALEAKPGVRLFARRDAFERFVSAMVFIPRERFSTELRYQIQTVLEKAFAGTTSSYFTQITDAPLARLHLIIKTNPGEIPATEVAEIERQVARLTYLWSDLLHEALLLRNPDKAEKLQRLYASAFPQNYINCYDVHSAVFDIDKIEEALATQSLALELWQYRAEEANHVHLKIYSPGEEIALSDIVPILESAGFRVIEERPFFIHPHNGQGVWIRDFKLQAAENISTILPTIKPLLEEALIRVWRREMENDGFNSLVLRAGLSWRQVVLLRAYAKYLRQVGFAYSQPSIEQAMCNNPAIAHAIMTLFEARFTPAKKVDVSQQETIKARIEDQLAAVSNVVEDRILRRYVQLISATLRTNFYQPEKPVVSFKFDSAQIPELPLPCPYREIFVYGTRVEGIHLRGGKVARGGLRWSDRHEDFRTEVLGLMKAQMVKNSVIVPVGSKGGFVVKHPPQTGGREAMMQEGIECYKAYLRGLLDITDNNVAGKIVPPAQVVRYDEDDPYLVVAADKGTASFSDIANSVSAEYGFWLGDAFASGGSAGYDHKKMGITARGAWVSVERHFSELGIDIAKKSFTTVGIGDMSGDVFGNGMLLSENIALVAAFNHMHIFIDPTPNPKTSFKERQRLFNLPRSSWTDYNAKLISKGGGIYERSAKSISLSKEAQAALGVSKASFTPDELMKAILTAPVDLLWNGGIGTYVKAEDESHEQVGDRSNNAVRVNGSNLRCKVVGEGGNLGFTQKGRIEYARAGGCINTDAIDNSAGVDCSDHEVNIKIAFSQEISKKKLTIAARDKQLTAMTDEVAYLVLKDNLLQTQAISIAQRRGADLLESQVRLMQSLERAGHLDRAIEFLPSEKQLGELREGQKGLTRPEIAVLLSYSKMVLYRDLLESTLPDEAYFLSDLKRYFPKAMQKNFADAIATHPLRREIIATVATNSLVNRAGLTFYSDIAADMGASARDVAAAYTIARDAFGLRGIWNAMEEFGGKVNVQTQVEMYALLDRFLRRVTVWLLRNLPLPLSIDTISKEILPGVAEFEKCKHTLHSQTTRRAAEKLSSHLQEQGVPKALAEQISTLELMESAFDIIAVARNSRMSVAEVGKIYYKLGARLRLGWLRISASRLVPTSHWDRIALQSIIGDVYDEQRRLTNVVVAGKKSIEGWVEANAESVARADRLIDELKSADLPDISKLTVALRNIRALGHV